MNTVNCTPTWKAAASIYLAVIEQEAAKHGYHTTAMKNARAGIHEMAAHLDRFNEENKKAREANEANLKSGTVYSDGNTFAMTAAADRYMWTVRIVADNYVVGTFNAVANVFSFVAATVTFTPDNLQELIATGNAMHDIYCK